jgi:hypothetical protein
METIMLAMSKRRLLTVLCETGVWDGILENHFIRETLLGGLDHPIRFVPLRDSKAAILADNVLIINLFDRQATLIRRFIDAGCKNIGVFHMGDESGSCDRSFYKDVDYVIRNYYIPTVWQLPEDCRCMEILWVPNGYRIGVGPRSPNTLMPSTMRADTLFFAGFVGSGTGIPERNEMIAVLTRCKVRATVIKTPGFAKGLGPACYAALMENSRFALVPRGQAAETIRLFDALELGCIPICVDDLFLQVDGIMGGSPVVRLPSWQRLPEWLDNARESPTYEDDTDEKQSKCVSWWSAFKQMQQAAVTALIERGFARSR